MSRKRTEGRGRDEPFAGSLRSRGGASGRRQAQRLTHRLIRYARRGGHDDLADWLADGFRDGRFTVEGAAAATEPLARTLAAVRLCDFVEGAEMGAGTVCDEAMLFFDQVDARDRVVASLVSPTELRTAGQGELPGTLLAAAFGVSSGNEEYRLRYVGVGELVPDPRSGAATGTLDLWDSLPPGERRTEIPSTASVFRVRFGWAEADGSVHLGRLEQALGGWVQLPPSTERRPGSRVARRLVLEGPPVFRSVSDSRLAADRWERVMLDGFVANQLVGYLLRRRAQRV